RHVIIGGGGHRYGPMERRQALYRLAWSGPGLKAERQDQEKSVPLSWQAGKLFCVVAQSLAQSKYLALGGFYRRIRGRHGGQVANIAAARKLAVLFYNTLRYGWNYVEQGLIEYEKRYKEQYLKRLKASAKRFGMQL